MKITLLIIIVISCTTSNIKISNAVTLKDITSYLRINKLVDYNDGFVVTQSHKINQEDLYSHITVNYYKLYKNKMIKDDLEVEKKKFHFIDKIQYSENYDQKISLRNLFYSDIYSYGKKRLMFIELTLYYDGAENKFNYSQGELDDIVLYLDDKNNIIDYAIDGYRS